MRKGEVWLAGIGAAFLSLAASAPSQARSLYFDIWCGEQGHTKERCDQRLPEDVAAFEEYWRAVEKYEEAFYVERQDYQNFRDQLNALDQAPNAGFDRYDPTLSPRPN